MIEIDVWVLNFLLGYFVITMPFMMRMILIDIMIPIYERRNK